MEYDFLSRNSDFRLSGIEISYRRTGDGKCTGILNIPYQIITRGENKGKLRVKSKRSSDGQAVLDARKELEYAGYGFLADHSNVFRDEDDRTVVTFSPYDAVPKGIDVPGYDVEVSDYSIYSYGTKTIVMRRL